MTKYETLVLCKGDLPEDNLQAIIKRLSDQVEANQGKLAGVDQWGNRRLGYPVSYRGAKYSKGFYILFTYLGGGRTVAEVERTIRLLEDIMRYQTVKLEEGIDPATITEVAQTRQRDDIFVPEPVFSEPAEDQDEEAPAPAARPEPAVAAEVKEEAPAAAPVAVESREEAPAAAPAAVASREQGEEDER
jgi:small subunit ribosomal protein S6